MPTGFLITAALIYLGCHLKWSREAANPKEKKEIWKVFWKKGFLILGIVLILAGWWFVRNYFLYDGDILGLKTQEQYAEHYAMDILKPSNRRTIGIRDIPWPICCFLRLGYLCHKEFYGVLGASVVRSPLVDVRRITH